MIKRLVIIVCLAAIAAEAHQLRAARLAPPSHIDTEVTTNVSCNLNLLSLKEYRLSLGLVGTPSNNVEVVLGHDADGDGILSIDEAALSLAWDCGAWIAAGQGGEITPLTGGPDTNGVVWAVVAVDIRRHRANPSWMYSDTWDLLRITARGIDAPLERVVLSTRVSGTLILVR